MVIEQLSQEQLDSFSGTENYYKHWLGQFTYTDGVMFLADAGKCHWLLDLIASHIPGLRKRLGDWLCFYLTVGENKKWVVECSDGNDHSVKVQNGEMTDFPLKEVKLYWIDEVLLLPSEY